LHWTIDFARWINTLPNANTNIGAIHLWQMLIAYILFMAIWLLPWFGKMQRWTIAFVLACVVLFIPNAIAQSNAFQVTLPAFNDVPIMYVKNQNQTLLINSGDRQFATFTMQPFLQKLGVNRLDWAISTDTQTDVSDGWNALISGSMAIGNFRDISLGVTPKPYQNLQQALVSAKIPLASLRAGEILKINNAVEIELINQSPDILKIKTGELSWLLLTTTDPKAQQAIASKKELLPKLTANILWWTGGQIEPTILQAINPKIAIASATSVVEEMVNQLYEAKIRVFWTGRDGAIQWTPEKEFHTLRDQQDTRSPI
jgi:competence protein ComEC